MTQPIPITPVFAKPQHCSVCLRRYSGSHCPKCGWFAVAQEGVA